MKKGKHHGGGKSFQRTLFKILRGGALVAPGVARAIEFKSNPERAVVNAVWDYSGFNMDDGKMYWGQLLRGWGPFAATSLATYGIPKIVAVIRRL